MKKAQKRREQLFQSGKPTIRPAAYDDIRWMWAAAKRVGFDGTTEEFTTIIEPYLAQAQKVYMIEDRNKEFASGWGPIGVMLCNFDEWALCPHAEWFPWASVRNKLRGTVGFLQIMRYTRSIGVIKISSSEENFRWFKWLKRFVAINYTGCVPNGREEGAEHIFYLRGRRNSERNKESIRREQTKVSKRPASHSEVASSSA